MNAHVSTVYYGKLYCSIEIAVGRELRDRQNSESLRSLLTWYKEQSEGSSTSVHLSGVEDWLVPTDQHEYSAREI